MSAKRKSTINNHPCTFEVYVRKVYVKLLFSSITQ